jgi:hypothetical protein
LERRVIYDGGEASRIACALPATGYETDAVQVSDCGSDAARVTGCQNGAEQETGCDQGHLCRGSASIIISVDRAFLLCISRLSQTR